MDKITGVLEATLVPWASKFSNNKYLKGITYGFGGLIPITMIGAIFTLLSTLPFPAYQNFLKVTHLSDFLSYAPAVTTNLLAVYAVLFISYSITTSLGKKQFSLLSAGLSLMSFLLLIPIGVTGVAEKSGETVMIPNAIGMNFLGAPGLFSAMIIGILVPMLFSKIIDRGWVIKMPDGVPPAISHAFSSMVPGVIIGVVFSIVRLFFSFTPFQTFNGLVYGLLQAPLMKIGTSPIAFGFFLFLTSFLWFFGIHGGQIVGIVLQTVYLPLGLENLAALESGVAMADLPHTISGPWWIVYGNLGGGGGTLGLCILLAFVAKSQQYKTLGKIALPASICGINEPIMFGLPIVLNPITVVPFVLAPIVTFTIAYGLTILGVVPPLNGMPLSIGTPVILSGWLTGGIKVAILQVILVGVQALIYFPFFRVLDKQALGVEVEGVTESIAN